ncbi:hypothetical protein [Pseudomonas chlororaphis]|uniref:hypothetical protein n=1 Tax=Pseudomonas chlororaphis TaxID=587753 RepID=UPI001B31392A|nr:hypothetical protein [Pseudomonas chlororaphis]MBP5078632.1 hypothetical protein [Pseudomonas chlororaphis]QTT88763.1 hypothetical protein HUT28_15745 [Pseudomonas chlororaphis]
MNMKSISVALLITLVALAGYDIFLKDRPTDNPRIWLRIPALPVIQDAIFQLSPRFDEPRKTLMMEQLCALARGEVKQEQVNASLKQQGIDAQTLPRQGSPYSLLVNGDQPGQASACAAYLATTVLSTVNVAEFMRPVTVPAANGQPEKSSLQIDNALLTSALSVKLAVARANADVFALIAVELQRSPGLTIPQYREQAGQLFTRLAPTYLQRIKEQLPPANTQYKLLQMDDSRFLFSSSVGSVFEFGRNGLVLSQGGIVWYGKGRLMGQEYPLQVECFSAAVKGLLTSPAPRLTTSIQ